jgi:hypothetical protein
MVGGRSIVMSVNEVFGAAKAELYNAQTTMAEVSTILTNHNQYYTKIKETPEDVGAHGEGLQSTPPAYALNLEASWRTQNGI